MKDSGERDVEDGKSPDRSGRTCKFRFAGRNGASVVAHTLMPARARIAGGCLAAAARL
jgi:hypothetical protein